MAEELQVPFGTDLHVHLRDGELMRHVVPFIRSGGVDTVYVMVILFLGVELTCWLWAAKFNSTSG